MSCLATWMNLEIIILSEVSQRQILYDITYSKKMIQMNLYIETGPQTQKTNLWLQGERGGGRN